MIKRMIGSANYVVTRANADGAYDQTPGNGGKFIPGASTTITINASIQPATPDDILTLPEGDRTKESFRFYSYPELKNIDVSRLREGDVVPYRAANYRVASVEHWPNYSKAIIVRVNTDDN